MSTSNCAARAMARSRLVYEKCDARRISPVRVAIARALDCDNVIRAAIADTVSAMDRVATPLQAFHRGLAR